MDIGYVILLLLGLVYCATAIFLYLRARQGRPRSEETPEAPPAEPRPLEAETADGPGARMANS